MFKWSYSFYYFKTHCFLSCILFGKGKRTNIYLHDLSSYSSSLMIYFGYHKCCCFKIINIYELLLFISLSFQMNRNCVSWTISRFKLSTHYFIKNKSFHLINVYIFELKSKLQKHKACQWRWKFYTYFYINKSHIFDIWWIIWHLK